MPVGATIGRPQGKRKRALLVKQFCFSKIMKRGHAHMKLLLRKNEVCTYGASVEVRREKGSTSSVVCDATFPKGEGLSRRFATSRQSVPTKQHVCLLAFALRLHQTFPYKNVRCACSCKPRFYVRKLFSKKVYETPLPSRVTPPFCFLFFCFAGFCFA